MADVPIEKLDELIAAIGGYADPRRASSEWKQVYGLLAKSGLPTAKFQAVVGMRNLDGLAALIAELRAPAADGGSDEDVDPETLKRAYRVFRKRVKFTRLDDESKLGRGPLSKGSDKSFGAISPPVEFPEAVWHALVRQGKIRYLGDGMYELAD